MALKPKQAAFSAGEVSPSLHERDDVDWYQVAVATLRNFFVHTHGGISNRTGTEFIAEIKDSSKKARLIPFSFNTEQTYIIVFGDQQARFVKEGGVIVLPSTPAVYASGTTYAKGDFVSYSGVNYYSLQDSNIGHQPDISSAWWYALTDDITEIKTSYLEAELPYIKYTQSADIMTLCHTGHAPADLSRLDHHEWSLDDISFVPGINAPTGQSAAWTGGSASTETYKYKITAVADETLEESVGSGIASVTNAEKEADWDVGEYVTISWSIVTGATKYNVYKEDNGIYGYIGSTENTSFKDDKIAPTLDDTPPKARNPFSGANKYPATVAYHEQRRIFGQTNEKPSTIWTSQTGNIKNLTVSSPAKADDAITVTIGAGEVAEIRHFVPLDVLMVLTNSAEFKMSGKDGYLDATSVPDIKPDGYEGCSDLKPLKIGKRVLFVEDKGYLVRDMGYTLESDGYASKDLSIRSSHLFEGHTIVAWAYARSPHSMILAIRDDGVLLIQTYHYEHQMFAWSRHDTDGFFEDVAVIAEGNEDAVYFIVKRTINGQVKRYIERLHTRVMTDITDAFFVDCGLTYEGAAATTISGLNHLEGKTVAVLADGNVHPQVTVTSGQITLQEAATKVHIGLPIEADLETLKPYLGPGGTGKKKSVSEVILKTLNSRGGWAGPDVDNLQELPIEAWEDPQALETGSKEVQIASDWDSEGKVFFRQSDPLPVTITAIIPEVALGG